MPSPRLIPLALAAALATVPAAAQADQVVIKRHGEATHHVARVASAARTIQRLARDRSVEYAVPDVKAHIAAYVPNDPGRGNAPGGWSAVQWNFAGPWGVGAPDAWQHLIDAGRPGGRGVVVAVLDTGVAYSKRKPFRRSPDLAGTRFVAGYDFVGRDPYANDRNGHGTHVASTIAESTNNRIALTGLAYGASIMPVRVLDDGGEGDASDIADGMRFAVRHGADVINLSLEFSTDIRASEIPELIDSIDYAHRKGVLVVGASGNEAHGSIAYPAKANHVVSVGSTTEHGCLSEFSNQGKALDLVAPGGGADAQITGDPNCNTNAPRGHDIFQMTLKGPARDRTFGLPGGYEGTSMAAPHVSAAAALVIASGVAGPRPSPEAIETRLETTARDLGAPGRDSRYGAGLLDAAAATAPAAPAR